MDKLIKTFNSTCVGGSNSSQSTVCSTAMANMVLKAAELKTELKENPSAVLNESKSNDIN